MAYWRNRKQGTHWRPRTWAPLPGVLAFIFIVAAIFSITWASHLTTTWPFTTAANYTFDSDKVMVTGGVAKLTSAIQKTWSTQAEFDAGTYTSNTSYTIGPPAGVKLTTTGNGASGQYTSEAIDSKRNDTSWTQLTSVVDLAAAPPANMFPNAQTIGSSLSSPTEVGAGDLNGDGIVDIVAGEIGTKAILWFQNADPVPTPFTKRVVDGAVTPCTKTIDQMQAPITRPFVADVDNDLDGDILFPNQGDPAFFPLMQELNPGGATPQCWGRSFVGGPRAFEDMRLTNINQDTYSSTDAFKDGQPIYDFVGAEADLGEGVAFPSGGVFWFRNDGTKAPEAPVYGTRSIDACLDLNGPSTGGPRGLLSPTWITIWMATFCFPTRVTLHSSRLCRS